MSREKVSIIVPVYNVQEVLERCLDSVHNQTYKNFQCILVDDGSTDGSGQMCDTYCKQDNRFTVIHQHNAGLSTARNNALKIANGRYVSFVDSDDYLMPTYLETMIRLMEEHDADIVKCDYHRGEIETVEAPVVHVMTGKKFTAEVLEDKIGSQLWQYIYKMKLWDGIVSPAGRYAQDMMILHNVTNRARKVVTTTEKLYFYYIDRANSTSNASNKKVKGCFDRAIAFMMRCDFSQEQDYKNCTANLFRKAMEFYNNALYLKQADDDRFAADIAMLSGFLKANRKRWTLGQVGMKYYVLGYLLAYCPYQYSKHRGH